MDKPPCGNSDTSVSIQFIKNTLQLLNRKMVSRMDESFVLGLRALHVCRVCAYTQTQAHTYAHLFQKIYKLKFG